MTFVKDTKISDVEPRRPQMIRFLLSKTALSLIDATKIQHPDFPLIRFCAFRAFLCDKHRNHVIRTRKKRFFLTRIKYLNTKEIIFLNTNLTNHTNLRFALLLTVNYKIREIREIRVLKIFVLFVLFVFKNIISGLKILLVV